MSALLGIMLIIFGVIVSVFCAMLSVKRRNLLFNLFTAAYAFLVLLLFSIAAHKPFDYLTASMFAIFLLVLGWYEATRGAREERRRRKDREAHDHRLSKWSDPDNGG